MFSFLDNIRSFLIFEPVVDLLVNDISCVKLKKDSILFKQGDRMDKVYLLLRGECTATV
jgi:CRP-like cAMP-binding protein